MSGECERERERKKEREKKCERGFTGSGVRTTRAIWLHIPSQIVLLFLKPDLAHHYEGEW